MKLCDWTIEACAHASGTSGVIQFDIIMTNFHYVWGSLALTPTILYISEKTMPVHNCNTKTKRERFIACYCVYMYVSVERVASLTIMIHVHRLIKV